MGIGTKLRAAWVIRSWPSAGTHRLHGLPFEVTLRGKHDAGSLARVFSRERYKPPPGVALERPRVLDLGASIGLFSTYAVTKLGAREVVAVEPDPASLKVLRSCVANNDLPVTIVEGCAGTEPGTTRFLGGAAAEPRTADWGELGRAVAMIDVFSLGRFDLIKADIEGDEWQLLADRRFPLLAPVVALEWHLRHCPGGDARNAAEELLVGHGYKIAKGDAPLAGQSNGLLWGVRAELESSGDTAAVTTHAGFSLAGAPGVADSSPPS